MNITGSGGDSGARARACIAQAVSSLSKALWCIRLYEPGHVSILGWVEAASQALAPLTEDGEAVVLKFVDGDVVVGQARAEASGGANDLMTEACGRLGVGALSFEPGVSAGDLEALLEALCAEMDSDVTSSDAVAAALDRAGVTRVRAWALTAAGTEERVPRSVDASLSGEAVYTSAMIEVQAMLADAQAGSPLDLSATKDASEDLVTSILSDRMGLMAMSAVKGFDAYTFTHLVNVAVLSLALGLKMGFQRSELVDLGLSALLHDVGKVRVPLEVLRKPGRLTDVEFDAIKAHPVEGSSILAALNDAPPVCASVALEHHLRPDGRGYPRVLPDREIHPFSVIVSVADCFDALTSPRPYRAPLRPVEALGVMYHTGVGQFDMDLLGWFAYTVGVHPVGGVVELECGAVGVVTDVYDDTARAPKAAIALDESGRVIDPPAQVGLSPDVPGMAISRAIPPADAPVDAEAVLAQVRAG